MTSCAALLCDAGDSRIAIPLTIVGSIAECVLLPSGHAFQRWLAGYAADPDTNLIPVVDLVFARENGDNMAVLVRLTDNASGWAIRVSGVCGVVEVEDANAPDEPPACPRSWLRPVRTEDGRRIWSLRPDAFAAAPAATGAGS